MNIDWLTDWLTDSYTLQVYRQSLYPFYMFFSPNHRKMEKNRAMLMSVETRGPRAFNALIESLVEAGQMDLAEKLGHTSSNISARSAEASTGHKELPGPFGQPRTQHQCTTGIGRFYFKKKKKFFTFLSPLLPVKHTHKENIIGIYFTLHYIIWLSLIRVNDWLNTVTWLKHNSVCSPPQSCGGGTLIDTTKCFHSGKNFHANKWQNELAILSFKNVCWPPLTTLCLFIGHAHAHTVQ